MNLGRLLNRRALPECMCSRYLSQSLAEPRGGTELQSHISGAAGFSDSQLRELLAHRRKNLTNSPRNTADIIAS
jgi:hypothetical protein